MSKYESIDPLNRIDRMLKHMQTDAAAQNTKPSGNVVYQEGNSAVFKSPDGSQTVLGGTQGVKHLNNPTPPVPAALTAVSSGSAVAVTWDGTLQDPDTAVPVYWDYIDVLADGKSRGRIWGMSRDSMIFESEVGLTHSIVGVAVSKSGARSEPSEPVTITVTGLEADLSEVNQRFTSVEDSINTARSELQASIIGNQTALESKISTAQSRADLANEKASTAVTAASENAAAYARAQKELDALVAAEPGLLADPSFELPQRWATGFGASVLTEAATTARTGKGLLRLPLENSNTSSAKSTHVYSLQDINVVQGRTYRVTAWLKTTAAVGDTSAHYVNVLVGVPHATIAGSTSYLTAFGRKTLFELGVNQNGWTRFTADYTVPASRVYRFGIQAGNPTTDLLVDDYQVTDVTELVKNIEDVKAAADSAQRAGVNAQLALTNAGSALTAANGKNVITYLPTPGKPTFNGVRNGDTLFVLQGNLITEQWTWAGAEWIQNLIDSQTIANLNVGKLTGVSADFGKHLSAKSISAEKLFIGSTENVIPNGWALSPEGWAEFEWEQGAWKIKGRKTVSTPTFPVTPGEHHFTVNLKAEHEGHLFYIQFYWLDQANQTIRTVYAVNAEVLSNGTYKTYETTLTVPPNTTSAYARVYANHRNGTVADDYVFINNLTLRPLIDGKLTVDGSIAAKKLKVNEVSSAVVESGLTTNTGGLNGVRLDKTGISVRDAQGAETVALRHDGTAYFKGKVEISSDSQIPTENLTGTIGTQKITGTFTDDQIPTLAQNKITGLVDEVTKLSNLNTKIDGWTVTGKTTIDGGRIETDSVKALSVDAYSVGALLVSSGAIQTSTTTNRGIKINDTGIQGYNSTGTQVFGLNSTDGSAFISGTFRSGPPGQPGVIIPQNYTTESNREQLGLWLSPNGTAPSLGAEYGQIAGIWLDNGVQEGMSRVAPLHIRGQGGGGLRVWGGLSVDSGFISSFAGNGLMIRGYANSILETRSGTMTLKAPADVVVDGNVTRINGSAGTVIASDGNIALRRINGNSYSQTWSGGGLVPLQVGGSSGAVYTQSSSRKTKCDIEVLEPDMSWLLDRDPVMYRDKKNAEEYVRLLEVMTEDPDYQMTPEEYERFTNAQRPVIGWIAEEAIGTGAENQVIYDSTGEVMSYDYTRDGAYLAAIVKQQHYKIEELEQRLANLEG